MSDRAEAAADSPESSPAALLVGISSMIRVERALWVTAELGVADHLAPWRPGAADVAEAASDLGRDTDASRRAVPVEAIAAAVAADPDSLYRVLRVLASTGIFSETEPRVFEHTPFSNALRSDAPDSVREIVRQQGGEREWRAWGEVAHTVRSGQPAYERVWGESPWRHYEQTRARMTQVSRADSAALAGHPIFSGASRIVDVAGGEGGFLAALLAAHPDTHGTLFDLPGIVRDAEEVMVRAGVADRCEIVAGDMFAAVPGGGDLYVLKRALHDWNDDMARALLRSIHRAMEGRGRLVILTAILPPGDAPSSAKSADLALLVMLGGRHRTAAELDGLLVETGFSSPAFIELPSSLAAVIASPR